MVILVVDNDPDKSARDVVTKFVREGYPFDLLYEVEDQRGISFARNRVLRTAKKRIASFIAFIDDDEYPDHHWINNLLNVILECNADVVAGPVFLCCQMMPLAGQFMNIVESQQKSLTLKDLT